MLNKVGAKDEKLVEECLNYLVAETNASNTANSRVYSFFEYNFANLFYDDESADFWEFWRSNDSDALYNDFYEDKTYSDLYQIENFPENLADFWNLLSNTLATAGFTKEKIETVLA